MKITQRQLTFARAYAASGCAAQAAREAGYSAKTAKGQGARLLTKEHVQSAVRTERLGLEAQMAMSRDRMVRELLEAVDVARAKADPGAMIAGWREVGRVLGYYEQPKEMRVSVNITAKRMIGQLETMSDSELLQMVERPLGEVGCYS